MRLLLHTVCCPRLSVLLTLKKYCTVADKICCPSCKLQRFSSRLTFWWKWWSLNGSTIWQAMFLWQASFTSRMRMPSLCGLQNMLRTICRFHRMAMQHGHVLPFNAILWCWNPPRMRMNFLFADTGRILSETVIDTHSVLQARHDKTTGQMDSPLDFLYFLPQRFPENGLKRLDLPA